MTKVNILQTDNRPVTGYIALTQNVNKKISEEMGYTYVFTPMNSNAHPNMHPTTQKIYMVNDLLNKTDGDMIVFLDSDAWIQNAHHLNDIITNLLNDSSKQGAFSRNPYITRSTFINSGSFIIKVNDYTKQMYNKIINTLENNPSYHSKWPYDQYYVSNYVFENKTDFNIFIPITLNTPLGSVLRHNWFKDQNMYSELNNILRKPLSTKDAIIPFDFNKNYDIKQYPNTVTAPVTRTIYWI